jgi:hypothetical protein
MRKTKTFALGILLTLTAACGGPGCSITQSTDSKIAAQQELQQAEAAAQVSPPSILNWNEKKILKLVQEKRDQVNLSTWTYTKNMDGKYTFVCESIGYGIPYDTRSNNPEHYEFVSTTTGPNNNCSYTIDGKCGHGEYHLMPQAEPNGLHIPPGAKGTWNLCKDPSTGKADVSYQEEDVAVFLYRLPEGMVEGFHPAPITEPQPNKPKGKQNSLSRARDA